jgi:hypothetical protein
MRAGISVVAQLLGQVLLGVLVAAEHLRWRQEA